MLLHSAPDPTLHVENLGTVDGPHRHSSRCSCSSLQGSRRSAPVRIFRNHPPSRDCSAEYTTAPVLRRTHLLECANGSAPHSQVLRAHAGMRKDYGECSHKTRLLGPRLRPHFEEKPNNSLRATPLRPVKWRPLPRPAKKVTGITSHICGCLYRTASNPGN